MFGPIGRKKRDAKYWKRQKILLRRRRREEREDIFEEKAGWNSFLGINSCFYMKWLVFHGTPSYISILDNMPWTSQYFSQVGVICLWEMSISCQLEIFTNSRKSIKGGQRNNGWKRVKTKMSNIFFRFWSWLERGGRWQNWSYRGHCDHSQVQPYIHSFFFYCDFEFGSIELSIHSIVLACGWYRWIWISETLHAPRLTQDNCIKNGIQMTREAKEEELAPAISQSTILKESLMWDILRLICELFPKSKMIQ